MIEISGFVDKYFCCVILFFHIHPLGNSEEVILGPCKFFGFLPFPHYRYVVLIFSHIITIKVTLKETFLNILRKEINPINVVHIFCNA